MYAFIRADRIEQTPSGRWFGWVIISNGVEERAEPIKFQAEPSMPEVETEGRALVNALNLLAASA